MTAPLDDLRLASFAARRLGEVGALSTDTLLRLLDLIDGHADAIEQLLGRAPDDGVVRLPVLTLADVAAAERGRRPAFAVIQGGRS